uniref:UDP-N-acetylglucosamine transferase subunit ALG13 n=1 Tax=Meloidogyne incognita TaxID=6306 RepID=A0A914LE11_MELIC
MSKCFVTVGSTQFEKLIFTILNEDFLQKFLKIGIDKLIIQNGNGEIPECLNCFKKEGEEIWEGKINGIEIELFRYKDSIRSEMEDADLIIGHAGAGTCLEVLELEKPFIAIINNNLMNNHQLELAKQLEKDGYLICTIPENLEKILFFEENNLNQLNKFPKFDKNIFCNFLLKEIF